MNKKPLPHLIKKVLIGLSLFAFLIFFILQLPQATSTAQTSQNAVQNTLPAATVISSTSAEIASANTTTVATFNTTTINDTTYTVTIPVVTAGPNTFANTAAISAVKVIKAVPATKPRNTFPLTTSVSTTSTKALTRTITIPTTRPVTKPATKPVTITATKPATKPVTQPATSPATKPATKPATIPVTIPATKPATKPVITAPPVTTPAAIYYRVTYIIDGITVKAERVLQNEAGKPPVIPQKSGYNIVGWNKSVAKVTSDLTVTAVYSKIAVTMPAGADEVFYVKTTTGTVKVYGTIDEADSKAAFDLVNKYRVANGVAPLKWDDRFFQAARQRAAECTINFSHTRPNGLSPVTVDTSIRITGENLAMGHGTPTRFFEAMKGSAGHNANLLKSSYKLSAIAVYKFDGYVFWAELFGY